jgi:hypothetical protein
MDRPGSAFAAAGSVFLLRLGVLLLEQLLL